MWYHLLAYIRNHDWGNKDEKALCLDMVGIIEDSASYEQLKGVAEYLVLLAEEDGRHEVLCATLAKMGCYEILCNVLPKLDSDGEWMEDTLLLCLQSSYIFSKSNSVDVKVDFIRMRNTIINSAPENLFNNLKKGAIP